MLFIYGISLVLWFTLMDVAGEKSLKSMDLSTIFGLIMLFVRSAIAALATYIVHLFGRTGEFDLSGAIFAPLGALCFYCIYMLFHKKDRESWKEFFVVDRWNAIALLGCCMAAFASATLR